MKKKIVIISYFFPPGKTPANRTLSWYRYFPKFDIYPIILTRASENNVGVEKTTHGEIHRIKARKLFNERLASKKIPTVIKVILIKLYHLTFGISKYDKTYIDFKNYFNANLANDCDTLIITGSPFILFRIGYIYAKEKNRKWIADYRDMWHLSDMPRQFENKIENLFRKMIGLKVEKKWINTAKHMTVTTSYFVPKLKKITKIPITTIENGFFKDEFIHLKIEKFKILTFVYVGTVYRTQKIDQCILAINNACKINNYKANFIFIGSKFNKKLRTFINQWDSNFLTIEQIPKVPKNECLNIQSKCHVGIMSSYGVKGIPSSKLYEFLGMKQPVLLFPSDNDIIEEKITKAGLGYSYSNFNDAVEGISKLIVNFNETKSILVNPNEIYINEHSRMELAKLFYNAILNNV